MSQNKKYPTFTIITICLNHKDGLHATQRSVEAQSFQNYEWIVIDGGSTDGTVDLLRQKRSATRQDTYPFQFVSGEDSGIYDAMNIGIKKARGRYLLFLNAGDCLASERILEAIAPHTEDLPDFIYGDALEPSESNTKPVYKRARPYQDIAWGMFTHHQAMFYNRLRVRDYKLRYSILYKVASDYDFTARFLLQANNIKYFPRPVCIFEQGGLSQKNAAIGRKEQYAIRETLEMVPQPQNLRILTVQAIAWTLRQKTPWLYYALKSTFKRPARPKKTTRKPSKTADS